MTNSFVFIIAFIFTLLVYYNQSIRQRPVYFSFLIAFICTTFLAYSLHIHAASAQTHIPSLLYWILIFLLAYLIRRKTIHSLLPDKTWLTHDHSKWPYHPSRLVIIVLLAALAAWFQFLYLQKSSLWGYDIRWYIPVLLWGVVLYQQIASLFAKPVNQRLKSAFHQLGSLPFAVPFQLRLPHHSSFKQSSVNHEKAFASDPRTNTAIIMVVLIAIALYMINPTAYPTDVHGDEAEVAFRGIEVRDSGKWNPFVPGWYDIPNLFFLIPAWGMWLFGDTLFGIRLTGALIGVASVVAFYPLARRFLQPKTAALAMLMFASSSMMIHFSRMGTGYNQTILVVTITLYCFVRAIQDKDLRFMALCGIVTAVGLLSYQANKLLPPLIVSTFVLLFILRKMTLRFFILGLLSYVFTFVITVSPLIGNYLAAPGATFSRTESVSLIGEAGRNMIKSGYPGDISTAELIQYQIGRSLLAPITYPDRSPYLVNELYGGILDPLHAIFLLAGLIILLSRGLSPPGLILLYWAICHILIGSALTNNAPSYQRLVGLIPILILIAAPALYGAASQTANALKLERQGKYYVLAFTAILVLVMSYHRYFHQIMAEPQFLDDSTRVARFLNEDGPTNYTYFFGLPYFSIGYGNIRFLAPDARGEDIHDPADFLQQKVKRRGPINFILIKSNQRFIEPLRRLYPGGKEIQHKNTHGVPLFITYEVNL